MHIKTTPSLYAWRISLIAVAANIVFSIGSGVFIDDIQISSLTSTASFTLFALLLLIFDGRHDMRAQLIDTGIKGFDPRLLPLAIILPIGAEMFCTYMTLPIEGILQFLFGTDTTTEIIAPKSIRDTVIAFTYLCILAPVSEEIVFRGIIYKYFERRSTYSAIFLSAFSFALAHLDIRSILPIFFIGLILSLIRHATGSILITMIAHAAVNIIALMSMVNDSAWASAAIPIICLPLFPFAMYAFLKRTSFPKLIRSYEKRTLSVCMILIIAVYSVFQIDMLVSNVSDMLENGFDFHESFGTDQYEDDIQDYLDKYFDHKGRNGGA